MLNYGIDQFQSDCILLSKKISDSSRGYEGIYGVPRGGIPLAISLGHLLSVPLVSDFNGEKNILVVDDLVDSGRTRLQFPDNDYATIHIKEITPRERYPTYWVSKENDWITYFWEQDDKNESTGAEDAVVRLLQFIGEDPEREGLKKTPQRFIKAYEFLFSGYKQDLQQLLTLFDSDGYNQMIVLKDIEMYSMCEHHLLPFFGKAHVAYIPDGKIIGISKLARLVDLYSQRAQIQERISDQVATALMDMLSPVGAACIIEANHLCMRMRGVQKQNSTMTTSSLKGIFLEDSIKGVAARDEFMKLIRS